MSVESTAQTPVITPSRLGRYLERKIAADRHLHYVGVQGEISNLRLQTNGNAYFSLKDRDAVLKCVGFSERAAGFPELANGSDVVAYGEVKIYPASSEYELIVARVELAGVGVLHAKYEELSRKLQREGVFADERKRKLPRFPFRVAVVGSRSGDGTRDFLTQARQRAPHVFVRLFETPVNGVGAVPDIVRAIAAADAWGADLLVVVRGGGSYEDLFGFSDERVVRAIAAATTPTLAAIGHERDVPLIELAADARASTPSTAAQTALPKRDDLLRLVAERAAATKRGLARHLERKRSALDRIERRSPVADSTRLLGARRQTVDRLGTALGVGLERRIVRARAVLVPLERRLAARSPHALLERRSGRVAQLSAALERACADVVRRRGLRLAPVVARLTAATARQIERRRAELKKLEAVFESNDPKALLARGYAIVTAGGRPLRDPADAPPGTQIEAQLARGTLRARVERDGADGGKQIDLF